MKYGDFEKEFLVATYREAEIRPNTKFISAEILDRYPLRWREGWVHQLVGNLGRRGLVRGQGVHADERSQPIMLTAEGMKEAEQLIEAGVRMFRFDEPEPAKGVGYDHVAPSTIEGVPASDRIVRLDHNNPDLLRAVADAKQLAHDLSVTNDVGDLSPDEVGIAVHEVSQIAASLEQPAIRMPSFGDRLVSTLAWIGKEAAGALVGIAALALLTFLATILGLSL